MVTAILALVVTFVTSGFVSISGSDHRRHQAAEPGRGAHADGQHDQGHPHRDAAADPFGHIALHPADQSSMQFYANLMTTGSPNRVDLYVDSTNPNAPRLIEELTPPKPGSNPPTWTPTGGTPAVRYVGQYVVNGTGIYTTPRFAYYDSSGTQLTPPVGQTMLDPVPVPVDRQRQGDPLGAQVHEPSDPRHDPGQPGDPSQHLLQRRRSPTP